MKIYLVQFIILYIISSINVIESSEDSTIKPESECYCPCLTTDAPLVQTTYNNNGNSFTTAVNSLSPLDSGNQKTTEKMILATKEDKEKVEEVSTIKLNINDSSTLNPIDYTIVSVIDNELTTQSNVNKISNQHLTDNTTPYIKSSTFLDNTTTTKIEEDISEIVENTTTTIGENKTLIIDEIKQTTENYETTEDKNILLEKENKTQEIVKELNLTTKIPNPRFSISKLSTKTEISSNEGYGIAFKILFFFQNIKKVIISNIFY
ncbi:Hypothetical protein SRAE_2000383400 [Strongyloides ratti]|uniref:Uncharacterized protein n=1 Tax=Strongyloides ratti TaxID=34506 RepID=A0A090MZM3_STRRB|nr:Hypothetical protein SRAE_2000383400 [Strongyloides ratti]CEF69184.1 Hypothetical protein SRAE_2000383400 [Strongyloides ratti]